MIEREDTISDYACLPAKRLPSDTCGECVPRWTRQLAATTLWPRGLDDQEGLAPRCLDVAHKRPGCCAGKGLLLRRAEVADFLPRGFCDRRRGDAEKLSAM